MHILFNRDCFQVFPQIADESIDTIFIDPPYFLSGGSTCQNGKQVPSHKGDWDQPLGFHAENIFHESYIRECLRVLKPNGSFFLCGTQHNLYQCGYILKSLGAYIINEIVWYKPNAAPCMTRRMFTHSHESVLWILKDRKAKHTFNYSAMKNGEFPEDNLKKPHKQMRTVWSIPLTPKREKSFGKHPTQKPYALLSRLLKAVSLEGDFILDPMMGSGTSGIAAVSMGLHYIGIESDPSHYKTAAARINSISDTHPNVKPLTAVQFEK